MISVVVPTYNEEDYLEPTLKSVVSQKPEHEVIVVDGGSDDETVSIAEEYADKVIEIGRGVSRARNVGAENSRGDIILFLDADTRLDEDSMEAIEECFSDDVVGMCGNIRCRDTLSGRVVYGVVSLISRLSVVVERPLFYGMCMGCTPEAFRKVGGFDEGMDIGEDVDFSLSLRKHGRCVWNPDAGAVTSGRRVDGIRVFSSVKMHVSNILRMLLFGETHDRYPVVR